jgi:hypothetical protein
LSQSKSREAEEKRREAERKDLKRATIRGDALGVRDELRDLIAAVERASERRLEYTGRLMLLNGGTLTLTFTALGVVVSKLGPGHQVVSLRILFWAWSLLIASMASCIVSQKFNVQATGDFTVANLGKLAMSRMSGVIQAAKEFVVLEGAEEGHSRVMGDFTRLNSTNQVWSRLSTLFLFGSELSTICAFVLLLLFMKANVVLAFGGMAK